MAIQEDALNRARAKAVAKTAQTNLCRMAIPQYVLTMARLIIQCQKILAENGRIALFMGSDARRGFLLDPAIEIFKCVQEHYERIDQIPFELDRSGPLLANVWVPSHGYALLPQIARKRSQGRVVNVQRNLWILRRRDKGSTERLV